MESIIKDSPSKTCRKFDKSFKCEAVRDWLSSGMSAAVIAKEFGLNESPKSSTTASAVTPPSEAFHPLSSNSKTTNQYAPFLCRFYRSRPIHRYTMIRLGMICPRPRHQAKEVL